MLKEFFNLGRALAKNHIEKNYTKEKSKDVALFLSRFASEPETYLLGWQAEWKIFELERVF